MSWLVEWPEYKPVEYTAASVLAQPTCADPAVMKGTSVLNLTKKMGILREGARMVCIRLKMVDLEILQVEQG